MNGRNRRRKDVPFNPFAQNAAAERNRRHAEKAKEKRRLDSQNQNTVVPNNTGQKVAGKTLQDLQRVAREKLGAEGNSSDAVNTPKQETPVINNTESVPLKSETKQIIPTITQTTAAKPATVNKQSRDERLAELKRKSQQSKDNAKLNKTPSKIVEKIHSDTPTIDNDNELELVADEINETVTETSENITSRNLNVFKTIQSVDPTSAGISKKKRKSRRMDKKGGGRQRLEKKLKSNKILEFKYVAREILSHPDVPEEHRSNVLGQIIAKGERISIDAAIEFIEQKKLELILTDEISDKLKSEIKSISTRR